jgi:hypothetical protein
MSLITQKMGQIFGHSVKKNQQLFISKSLGVINFLNEGLQPRFFAEKMTGQKR